MNEGCTGGPERGPAEGEKFEGGLGTSLKCTVGHSRGLREALSSPVPKCAATLAKAARSRPTTGQTLMLQRAAPPRVPEVRESHHLPRGILGAAKRGWGPRLLPRKRPGPSLSPTRKANFCLDPNEPKAGGSETAPAETPGQGGPLVPRVPRAGVQSSGHLCSGFWWNPEQWCV